MGAFTSPPNQAILDRAKALIPPGASLAASNTLGTRFAHRPRLYVVLDQPTKAEYVFIDIADRSLVKLGDLTRIAPPTEYRTLIDEEGLMLLERR